MSSIPFIVVIAVVTVDYFFLLATVLRVEKKQNRIIKMLDARTDAEEAKHEN